MNIETLPSVFPQPNRRTTGLKRERRFTRRAVNREFHDARKLAAARDVLTSLPDVGYAFHILHCGHFDGCDLLVRAIELAGPCQHLRIVSLGVNDRTLATILAMLDVGAVETVTLLLSHYFRSVDGTLYERVHGELTRRSCTVAIGRVHAKIWVFGPYTFEGSGNLRSCKSAEQLTITNDAELAAFHSDWINELVKEWT